MISRANIPLKANELVMHSIRNRMGVNKLIAKETRKESFSGLDGGQTVPFGRWIACKISM
jgi:hypothetical protein